MAETDFAVTYEGPALLDGRMPVRDLAPALLALGDLFAEASLVEFPDLDPVALNIKAMAEGSFAVQLVIHSPDTWNQLIHTLSGATVTALVNLQSIVIGEGAGLLWLIKAIRGREVKSQQPANPGHVRLELDDGMVIEAQSAVVKLYERREMRRSAKRVVEPLSRLGVDRVRFTANEQDALSVGSEDLSAYEVPELVDESELSDKEVELVLSVVTASFEGNYKWRFSEGDNVVTASIEDSDFRSRIDFGEPFRKGDYLRVRMRVRQTDRAGKLHIERTILQVTEHIPRAVRTWLVR